MEMRGTTFTIAHRVCWLLLLLFCPICTLAAEKEIVAVFREYNPNLDSVFATIRCELKKEFNVYDLILTKKSTNLEVTYALRRWNPKCVILLGDNTLELYKNYQSSSPDSIKSIPSLGLIEKYNNQVVSKLKDCSFVVLEIPVVNALMAFQSVVRSRLKSIGVLYRENRTQYIERNRQICTEQNIDMYSISLSNKESQVSEQLRSGLSLLLDTAKVQCLYVPSDTALFQTEQLRKIWNEFLTKSPVPVIVNYETVVRDTVGFAVFAVRPDYANVGSQFVDKVYELKNSHWKSTGQSAEYLLSLHTVLNVKKVNKALGLKGELFTTLHSLID